MRRTIISVLCSLCLPACAESGDDSDEGGGAEPMLIDGIELVSPDDLEWASAVDNPYFPLPVGATWHFEAMTDEGMEVDDVEVLAETREIQGITATVVYDVVYLDGEIAEETWDWYAQDADGNVWYLGEDTCEFENGECVRAVGAWEWGVDGAEPGIIMPADPMVDGQPYFQEYFVGEAEDVGEVIGAGEAIEVAAGGFSDCVRTHDTSHLDPELDEEKVFCPGIGNVYVSEPGAEVELTEYTGL